MTPFEKRFIQVGVIGRPKGTKGLLRFHSYLNDDRERTYLSKGKENIPNKISINIYGKKKFIENVNDIKMIWNENENKLKRDRTKNDYF